MTEITFAPTEQALQALLAEVEKMRRGSLSQQAITIEATRITISKGFRSKGLQERKVVGNPLDIIPVLIENLEVAKGLTKNRELQVKVVLRVLGQFKLVKEGVKSLQQAFSLIDRLKHLTGIEGLPEKYYKALDKVRAGLSTLQLQFLQDSAHSTDTLADLEKQVQTLETRVSQAIAAPTIPDLPDD